MPDEHPTAHDSTVEEPPSLAYEPAEEEDDWLDEPDELPPRPRRRLLKPVPLALLGVLLTAAGFIAGVYVQKGQESPSESSASGAGLASRFAALRGTGTTRAGSGASRAGAAAGFAGPGAAGGRATSGTVAYLAGSTLYVTSAEGNTVKVDTSPGTSVTATVKTKVTRIHPGETVTVTGATGSSGAVSAEAISVGSSAGALAALLGGGSKSSTGAGGGATPLFGSG